MVDFAQERAVGRPKSAKAEKTSPEVDRKYEALVRVSEEVAQLAREIAPMVGKSMAELISDILKPILEKTRADEMRKRLGK